MKGVVIVCMLQELSHQQWVEKTIRSWANNWSMHMLAQFNSVKRKYELGLFLVLLFVLIYMLTTNSNANPFSRFLSDEFNNFEIQAPLIPAEEIYHGGPPRDGIPAIDTPRFVSIEEAMFLQDQDRVLGIHRNGIAKAYPIAILNWHEIVNDKEVLISYCPLCGTGMAFKVDKADFGVSGLLYNSDMLLYDRKTESLWSQILAKAISGKRKGERLTMLPLEHTTWHDWKSRNPNTLVLSTDTGYSRDYTSTPYGNYETSSAIYFPIAAKSRKYHPKEKVIGIHIGNTYKAYPFIELDKTGKQIIQDQVQGKEIRIHFNSEHRSGMIKDTSGKTLPSLISFWFAWYAFHPETLVYSHLGTN